MGDSMGNERELLGIKSMAERDSEVFSLGTKRVEEEEGDAD